MTLKGTARLAAYVYPGWHPIPERDERFYPGFTEWDLVLSSRPRFPGHVQPRLPAWGRYDDRDPVAVGRRIAAARAHGIDVFVYGTFWCRGKRVFEDALDHGFLGSPEGRDAPFAVMWANRMPRRVLPVRREDLPVIDPERLVSSDIADFAAFVTHLAERYFARPNYLRIDDRPYLSIFDSTFFVRELGFDAAREAIVGARRVVRALGFPDLHLAAIEPAPDLLGNMRDIGFDSITNYVLLPYWKGPFEQDYRETSLRRSQEWAKLASASGLPYHPSVSPGWDATPRGADFGARRPDKYPWWPVVTGEHPELFADALGRALDFSDSSARPTDARLVFIASLNEWSEGHYLEPDDRFGLGWLEAVRHALSSPRRPPR